MSNGQLSCMKSTNSNLSGVICYKWLSCAISSSSSSGCSPETKCTVYKSLRFREALCIMFDSQCVVQYRLPQQSLRKPQCIPKIEK
eukprot:10116-Heterococcus_DN1.PRE.2